MKNYIKILGLSTLLFLSISCGDDDDNNTNNNDDMMMEENMMNDDDMMMEGNMMNDDDMMIEEGMMMEGNMMSARFESQTAGEMNMETLLDTETNLVWINDIRGCFAGIVNPTTQCDDLTFAGRSDWRVPTPDEMANLITAIDQRGMMLNYINNNCALMSTNDAVWVFTENSNAPGEMTMMEPGNAGVRCVTENN